MKNKNVSAVMAVTVLTLLIVILLVANSVRRSAHIHLPDTDVSQETEEGVADGSAINQLSVTPETVQQVIATLYRPERYTRSVTVEQLWSGGSGTMTSTVSVREGWTRTDTQLADGTLRHSLTDGKTTHIWYGAEKSVYTAAAGEFTPDTEQGIPTYEDVLALPAEEILRAGYRSYADTDCVYVEAALADEARLCYWVSVSDGLLTAAEQYEGETLVYRMTAATTGGEPEDSAFILPDGTGVLPE